MKTLLAAVVASTAMAPSPAQVRTAVDRAIHSSSLWATVNVCDTPRHRDVIGIRGQMPGLGFPAQLTMTIRLAYWNARRDRFEPVRNLAKRISLGTVTRGTVQEGAELRFRPPVILSGQITFRWFRDGRLLASTTKLTSAGDSGVRDADPAHYSAATCSIGG